MENKAKFPGDFFLRDLVNHGTMVVLHNNRQFYYLPIWFEQTENGFIGHYTNHLPMELKEFLIARERNGRDNTISPLLFADPEMYKRIIEDYYKISVKPSIALDQRPFPVQKSSVRVSNGAYPNIDGVHNPKGERNSYTGWGQKFKSWFSKLTH